MSSLEPRGTSRPTRAQREQRAYRLVMIGGTSAAVAVVGFVLALVTSFPGTVAFIAAVVAIVCAVMFGGMTRRRS